jgi:hypothetical protein
VANITDITGLEGIVDSLPAGVRALFRRIYTVANARGELRLPENMYPWVEQQFGSVASVTGQQIVSVTNKITHEGSLFNRLRAARPNEASNRSPADARQLTPGKKDMFARPELATPEDTFGRVTGKHSITASNIAKCDGLHGLVIFNEFQPLSFSREQVVDYIDVAQEWAVRAQAKYPRNRYFFFCWNCLWRSGASIIHGHAQMMLTSGRHYAKIEGLRSAALRYRRNYGSNYFSDLFLAHESVGCAREQDGVKTLAYLTPFKDNEVMLMADELNLAFKERLYEVLASFRDRMGVTSFNLGLVTRPLAKTRESWDGFPVIAWLVDRGDLASQSSDVGSMEMFASSVISSDPLELAGKLWQTRHFRH